MSELRSERATPSIGYLLAPSTTVAARRGEPAPFVRPYAPANDAIGAALVGARDALRRTPFSREALRTAVVRYGAVSRDAGASVSDLTDALDVELAPALSRFPAALAAELRVHVGWWAAHGYHRAD